MQISCLPHIFEAFLWNEINEERSKCIFGEGYVLFELQKLENLQWNHLTLQKSKEELKAMKCEILNSITEELRKKSEQKSGMRYYVQLFIYTKSLRDIFAYIRNNEPIHF